MGSNFSCWCLSFGECLEHQQMKTTIQRNELLNWMFFIMKSKTWALQNWKWQGASCWSRLLCFGWGSCHDKARKLLYFIFRMITYDWRKTKNYESSLPSSFLTKPKPNKNNFKHRNKRIYSLNDNDKNTGILRHLLCTRHCVKHFISSYSLKIMRKLRLREFN